MPKIIHSPADIVKGKLYKTVKPQYRDNILYLGCAYHNILKPDKFLVIVMDETGDNYIGSIVVPPDINHDSLWTEGFEELE